MNDYYKVRQLEEEVKELKKLMTAISAKHDDDIKKLKSVVMILTEEVDSEIGTLAASAGISADFSTTRYTLDKYFGALSIDIDDDDSLLGDSHE